MEQQGSLRWPGTLTYLMATPKRLKVTEFTGWTGITTSNFFLLHKGSKETMHHQGLNFSISNCFPAKVISDEYF